MKALSPQDQEVLRLLSAGFSDDHICRALELAPSLFHASLERIQDRASVETGDAGRYYEQALRLRAEKRIAALQKRFSALIDLVTTGILVVDGKTGVIKECNQDACRLFGYPLSEFIGLSVEDLVDDEYRTIHPALRRGFLLSARKREMGYHPPIFGVRKDGTRVEIALALTAAPGDDDVLVVCTEHARWAMLEKQDIAANKNGPH